MTIVTLKLHSQTTEKNNLKFSLRSCTGVNKCVNLSDKKNIIIVVLNLCLFCAATRNKILLHIETMLDICSYD